MDESSIKNQGGRTLKNAIPGTLERPLQFDSRAVCLADRAVKVPWLALGIRSLRLYRKGYKGGKFGCGELLGICLAANMCIAHYTAPCRSGDGLLGLTGYARWLESGCELD